MCHSISECSAYREEQTKGHTYFQTQTVGCAGTGRLMIVLLEREVVCRHCSVENTRSSPVLLSLVLGEWERREIVFHFFLPYNQAFHSLRKFKACVFSLSQVPDYVLILG